MPGTSNLCLHCQERPLMESGRPAGRGLCYPCYSDKAIRVLWPLLHGQAYRPSGLPADVPDSDVTATMTAAKLDAFVTSRQADMPRDYFHQQPKSTIGAAYFRGRGQ